METTVIVSLALIAGFIGYALGALLKMCSRIIKERDDSQKELELTKKKLRIYIKLATEINK